MIDARTHRSPNHEPREQAITAIVAHHGGGTAAGDLAWLCNPASKVSSHYYVTRAADIYQLVDDNQVAWHAGRSALAGAPDVNAFSIGIELEHTTEPEVIAAGHPRHTDWPAAQLEALAWLCREKMDAYHIPTSKVVSHRAVALPRGRKVDPVDAPLGPEEAFRAWVDATLGAPPVPPAPAPYTPSRPLLAPPGAPMVLVASRVPHGGAYTARDAQTIAEAYYRIAGAVGVDPVLALAQLCHETGGLSSWWAQLPRCNPAGIGVTGETHPLKGAAPGPGWESDGTIWKRGLSFGRWDPTAIEAHVGRLLAYARTDMQASPPQRALIARALAWRPLPAEFRGAAPTVAGLSGRWAADPAYAEKVARWANQLAGQ
jgi:hypothetical protein